MDFYYYQPEDLIEIAEKYFEILKTGIYSEMENSDSVFIILKKNKR